MAKALSVHHTRKSYTREHHARCRDTFGKQSARVGFVGRELELRDLALDRIVFVPALTAHALAAVTRVARRAPAGLLATRFPAVAVALARLAPSCEWVSVGA